MPNKTEEYLALACKTADSFSRQWEHWAEFLITAARLYKYSYPDQLMIYAQRPDATACAEYDVWNNKMNRYVRRGSKGIALLDESGGYPRLHYVFDVSDTAPRRNALYPDLWQINESLKEPVRSMLAENYGVHSESFGQQLADLTNTRFSQHAIETIKNDDFGIAEHLVNYPAVVISANEDAKAVVPEVIRRTVICRVQAGLTNTEVMSSNIVRTVQREVGTALYREYLRQMLEIVPELLELMKDDEQDEAPDILKASSQVLMNIFKEYGPETLPEYIRVLSLEDYFSEKVTGSYAIKTIQNAWKTSKDSFEIYPRTNELCYNEGATYEADRILKELPETLEVRKSRDCLMMNLEEAQKFFGITFKKPLFPWLSKIFA